MCQSKNLMRPIKRTARTIGLCKLEGFWNPHNQNNRGFVRRLPLISVDFRFWCLVVGLEPEIYTYLGADCKCSRSFLKFQKQSSVAYVNVDKSWLTRLASLICLYKSLGGFPRLDIFTFNEGTRCWQRIARPTRLTYILAYSLAVLPECRQKFLYGEFHFLD